MKTHKLWLSIALANMIAGLPAVAADQTNDAPLVPSPSIFDFSQGDGWGFALGAGIEYETAYDGADEYEFEVDPAGAIHYRSGDHMLFWEGVELGWRGLVSTDWLVQAGVRYESGLEADDSDDGNLDGLPDRDSHVVGFLEGRYQLNGNWRNWIGGRIMGGDSDFGWLGVIAAGHRFGSATDGTGTEVFVFSTFGNADFINKDFGISAADSAASGLTEIDLDGGYRSTGITLVHRRDLTENLHLIGQVGVELYSSDIQDSDIAREDFEGEIGLSAVWVF